MKAVFLDSRTFSKEVALDAPQGVSEWVSYPQTAADDIAERLIDADIAIVNKVPLTGEILEALPRLKLVQISATGVDNVDVKVAEKQGIVVQNVAGYSVNSVSEHTMMLLLSVLRATIPYHQAVNDGSWTESGQFCLNEPSIEELYGKTLGIIGIGAIAKNVTKIAKAFGMKVLWAEHQGKIPRNESYIDFDTVLAESDAISLHCPLNIQTKHLINAQAIKKMVKKPVLINVARGVVIDVKAVFEAVKSGELRGLGCDVFDKEPPEVNHPLLQLKDHPRVVLSAHNAWASLSAQRKLWSLLQENVSRFIKDNQL